MFFARRHYQTRNCQSETDYKKYKTKEAAMVFARTMAETDLPKLRKHIFYHIITINRLG